ncbi:MAG: hypothetical protein DRI40_01355 [Chloroflexi bacterium]|nr:MAG: hypothetical protein DRI40_01355 [Chloroflexota bacterium]
MAIGPQAVIRLIRVDLAFLHLAFPMKLPVFLAAVGRWATGMVAEARKPTFSTSREGWVGLARGVQRIE